MAKLVKCKECGAEISKKAETCPKCGANRKSKHYGCGTLIVVVVIGFWLMSMFSPDSTNTSTAVAPKPVKTDAECKKDFGCWFDRHNIDAQIKCRPVIESQAKYQFEWTDGMLEQKFPDGGWIDKKKGVIFVRGDKVKFQNGFGAWQIHTYQCSYDPATKQVVGVIVKPRG